MCFRKCTGWKMLDKLSPSLIALEDVFDMINSTFLAFWQNRVKLLPVNGRTVFATAGAICPESGHSDYGSVIYGLPVWTLYLCSL